jgi:hypothetical protein
MGFFSLFGQKNTKNPEPIFRFQEPENTACMVCDHALEKRRPMLYASHDEDGGWQFLCGHNDHSSDNAKVISLKNATLIDPSINELWEMPILVGAERKSPNHQWKAFRIQADQTE